MHELFREMLYYKSWLSKSEELDEEKGRTYEERYNAILDTASGKCQYFPIQY